VFDRKHLRMCRRLWSARVAVIAEGAALGFFAMLAVPGAATAAGPTQPFQYGLWQGGAYTNDQPAPSLIASPQRITRAASIWPSS